MVAPEYQFTIAEAAKCPEFLRLTASITVLSGLCLAQPQRILLLLHNYYELMRQTKSLPPI